MRVGNGGDDVKVHTLSKVSPDFNYAFMHVIQLGFGWR